MSRHKFSKLTFEQRQCIQAYRDNLARDVQGYHRTLPLEELSYCEFILMVHGKEQTTKEKVKVEK